MLAKAHRLRTREEFDRLFADGKAYHADHFVVRALKDPAGPKIGFIVGKRVSAKATLRNRTKRRLRGWVRAHPSVADAKAWAVVIAKPGAESLDSAALDAELTELMRKATLLR